jgi:hypothetical protein
MTKNPTVRPEHLVEVFTEIRMRKDVYPRRIAERLMTPKSAENKIALMTQVHEVLMWLHENKKPADSPYPPGICGLSAHIKELKTELNWRDRVYNRKVLLGQMKPDERDLKIRLMEEVKAILEQMQAHNLAVQTSLF